MLKRKLLILLVLECIPFLLFSQEKFSKNSFHNEISNIAKKFNKEINFNKAQIFFIERNWDSTLIYSMKQLDIGKEKKLKDYCHYFRGYCFKEKKLYNESKKEFNKISF